MAIKTLKNKRILITAGPTWVPIDNVRVISNVATGETGILLALEAKKQGAKVTLLLGPANGCCLDQSIKIIPFKFFNELKYKLTKELRTKKYDVLIHSSAVADYRPQRIFAHKLSSDLKNFTLKLIPTPKLINRIKKDSRALFSVGFKFKPGANRRALIKEARVLMKRSAADLVVANTIYHGRYNAYIVDSKKDRGAISSKEKLARILIQEIKRRFSKQNFNY